MSLTGAFAQVLTRREPSLERFFYIQSLGFAHIFELSVKCYIKIWPKIM